MADGSPAPAIAATTAPAFHDRARSRIIDA
jgi:hypothetical protein